MGQEKTEIEQISLEGFEVVRGEFISQVGVPQVTFDGYTVSFNISALKALPDAESVLFIISRHDKTFCVRHCRNGEKNSFRWSSYAGKRVPRKVTCEEFVLRLLRLTDWSFDYRYKLLGSIVENNGIKLLKFDLSATQATLRKNVEDGKRLSRKPVIGPECWQETFGVSLSEQEKEATLPTFKQDTIIIIGSDDDGDE